MMTANFAKLSSYGNYEYGKVPKRGYTTIPLDGTKRYLTRLGIPYVAVVRVENVYGNTYFPRTVGYVIRNRDKARLDAAIDVRKSKRMPKPLTDIILAIREISRAAHRERDAAEEAYSQSRYLLASNSKSRKNNYYNLKDRGIVAAYKSGTLRYVGQSPQGLAVYEYGSGGMSCFHSTLHPAGVERPLVEGHPEILEVAAKDKIAGVSIQRLVATREALPEMTDGFIRVDPPRKYSPRSVICWRCGLEGHRANECDEDENEYVA